MGHADGRKRKTTRKGAPEEQESQGSSGAQHEQDYGAPEQDAPNAAEKTGIAYDARSRNVVQGNARTRSACPKDQRTANS